ncbi:hypothetical protein SS50377_20360 [Spironucleus salmonicida]|uniref:Uncharacterized protein n=1 Tax=Spironucleus salmonicida TaxID=348837 RepID=V6LET3_9EUKA|nr:hypothetical protein SS50377_20360 [Spironucleus salmonicida]|eukprot:EST43040.1 hypothetical protein SS50377_17342 [Spironucleus salmonicida]
MQSDVHPVFVVPYNQDSPLSRLSQTQSSPFCLTLIDGFPLLQHSIYSFYINGITNFTIQTPQCYQNALESFIAKILNPSAKRARYGLEICTINLITDTHLKKLSDISTQNFFFIQSDIFYSGITERLGFLHRKFDATGTIFFTNQEQFKVKNCGAGCISFEEEVEMNVSKMCYFKPLNPDNITENKTQLLKIKSALLKNKTAKIKVRNQMPAGFILAKELLDTLSVNDDLCNIQIFEELLEFLVEQQFLKGQYRHPAIQTYCEEDLPSEFDEIYDRCPINDDLQIMKRKIVMIGIQMPEIPDNFYKHNFLLLKEKVETMQQSIFNERVRNNNMSVQNLQFNQSFDSPFKPLTPRIFRASTQLKIASFSDSTTHQNPSKNPKLEIFINANSLQNMLKIRTFLHNSSIYENALISMKYATIDAQNSTTNAQNSLKLNVQKLNSIFSLIGQNTLFQQPLIMQKWDNVIVLGCENARNCLIGGSGKLNAAQLENCQIGDYVVIQEGVKMRNCVVFDNSEIVSGEYDGCVIGANCILDCLGMVGCVVGGGVRVRKNEKFSGEQMG